MPIRFRKPVFDAASHDEDETSQVYRVLLLGEAKWEPLIARIKRMVKHWQAEYRQHDIPQDYRESLCGTDGRTGAITLMNKTLGDFGLRSPTPGCWVADPWQPP